MLGTRARWTGLTLPAAVVLLVGCSSGGDGAQAPEAAGSEDRGEAVEVVAAYLDALRAGDIDAALQYRCSDVGDLPVDVTRDQIERLAGITSEIEAVELREIGPTELGLDDPEDMVVVGYRVVTDGERHPEMQAITRVENGERLWCGHATPITTRFFDEKRDEQVAAQPTSFAGPLVDFMPGTGPPGETVLPDQPTVPTHAFETPHPGQLDSWTRAWDTPRIGGSRVSAVRFETEQQAVDAARLALRMKFHEGVETFPVERVPGAVGIRVVQLAWLDLQPPDVGPYVDWVYVVYGNTVIEAASSELSNDPDHESVAGLVRQVHSVAAGPTK